MINVTEAEFLTLVLNLHSYVGLLSIILQKQSYREKEGGTGLKLLNVPYYILKLHHCFLKFKSQLN